MTAQARFAAALAIVLGACSSSAAQAGVMSGQDLMDICEPARADPVYRLKIAECAGYIIGVSDTFDCERKTLGFTWDSTRNENQSDLIEGVVQWLHRHPNALHYQASGLVASALEGRFPCSRAVMGTTPKRQ